MVRGGFQSVQVNVDADGNNIPGDAANEPTMVIDPLNPANIAVGWRQFDTITSDFRQAGYAYSRDAGATWTKPGPLMPGVFNSDPVMAAAPDGTFYYITLDLEVMRFFQSFDQGATWSAPSLICGGFCDKSWMTVDHSQGMGRGNIYTIVSGPAFSRSTDGGETFPISLTVHGLDYSYWGTMAVSQTGVLYLADRCASVASSVNAQVAAVSPTFEVVAEQVLGGACLAYGGGPNPGGLLGQMWIAADHFQGPCRGRVFVLASAFGQKTSGILFSRSDNGGVTWSAPIDVTDDPPDSGAIHWFGTLSIAPNGRLDAIWNDTRNTGASNLSEVFYAYSFDAGVTWSRNVAVTPVFDSHVGWPLQQKLGDYCHMISDDAGANLAFAATFNGEQDVYFLRLIPDDCDGNGLPDAEDIAAHRLEDCTLNGVPDECEADCNANGAADSCDIAGGISADATGNRLPDECERDDDEDGIPNECDRDADNDGIDITLDRCPLSPLFTPPTPDGGPQQNLDSDCILSERETRRMVACLAQSGPGTPAAGACGAFVANAFDIDDDLDVDLKDFRDFQLEYGRGSP